MNGRWTQIMAMTALAAALACGAYGYVTNDFAAGVNNVTDTSPDTAASHINDYFYQEEQVNINPDSGIVRVLRTDQKALVNDFVTEFIPLKKASARELRGLARTICRKEGGDADVCLLKKDPKQFNGMVVVCPAFQLPYIRKTLEALDQEWVSEKVTGSWTYYYKAKHRDIQTVERITRFYATPDRVDDIDL
ncbi:MAG: hypothetical protein NTX50_12740, partial [Candidatus Sumerlaeota bacterium]|nr:hypothetical protein [Candidatus Sumerlaeota bacterium]